MGRQEPGSLVDGYAKQVIGAAIAVHRAFGPGYLESVYEDALAIELEHREIPFTRQHAFSLHYRGRPVGEGRIDLFVANSLVVELKAVEALQDLHHAQVISYLKATGNKVGLLINFNVKLLRDGLHRVVLS